MLNLFIDHLCILFISYVVYFKCLSGNYKKKKRYLKFVLKYFVLNYFPPLLFTKLIYLTNI